MQLKSWKALKQQDYELEYDDGFPSDTDSDAQMGVGMCELFIFPFGVAIFPGVPTEQGAHRHEDLPTLFPLSTWEKTTYFATAIKH